MRLVIFGSNGPTGRLATARGLAVGHSVVAVTRRPREFPFAHPGLTVVEGDVRHGSAVMDAVAGADAVVSVLGVPFTRRRVDTYSAGGREHPRGHARIGNSPARRRELHVGVSHPTPTRAAFTAAGRANHQGDRQDGLRRHAAHGSRRAPQRHGLDGRPTFRIVRPSRTDRLRMRSRGSGGGVHRTHRLGRLSNRACGRRGIDTADCDRLHHAPHAHRVAHGAPRSAV